MGPSFRWGDSPCWLNHLGAQFEQKQAGPKSHGRSWGASTGGRARAGWCIHPDHSG